MCAALLTLNACAMFGSEPADQIEDKAAAQPVASIAEELQTIWGVNVDQREPKTPFSYAAPVFAGDMIAVGAQDQRLHIYNMHGSELRRVALDAVSDSAALSMGKMVVLGDAQGKIYGIDVQQGNILWKLQLPSVMLGHPARIGEDMIVQTGDNSIYRISAKGEKLWSFSGPASGLSMHLSPSPLIVGDVCYAVMSNGDALALRSDSGDLLWRRQLLIDNDAVVLSELKAPLADPVLIDGVLIVSLYQGDVVGISARDGQQLWQRTLSLKSTPLVHDGHVFASTSSGAVMELEASTGASLWKQKLDAGELVGPALYQSRLYVADDRGQAFALSQAGKPIARLNLPGRVDRAPVATPEGVLLRNNLGGLYLIR